MSRRDDKLKLKQVLSRCKPSGNCIEWTGPGCTLAGRRHYGTIPYKGKMWRAHRLVWTLTKGPIKQGLWVLHKCDNPPCVNIKHLYLGTHADNVRDMLERRRFPNANKAQCKYGHPLSGINVIIYSKNGRLNRVCRSCGWHRKRGLPIGGIVSPKQFRRKLKEAEES